MAAPPTSGSIACSDLKETTPVKCEELRRLYVLPALGHYQIVQVDRSRVAVSRLASHLAVQSRALLRPRISTPAV